MRSMPCSLGPQLLAGLPSRCGSLFALLLQRLAHFAQGAGLPLHLLGLLLVTCRCSLGGLLHTLHAAEIVLCHCIPLLQHFLLGSFAASDMLGHHSGILLLEEGPDFLFVEALQTLPLPLDGFGMVSALLLELRLELGNGAKCALGARQSLFGASQLRLEAASDTGELLVLLLKSLSLLGQLCLCGPQLCFDMRLLAHRSGTAHDTRLAPAPSGAPRAVPAA
mmetsp:Transcript_37688/g.82778  ORF Transcript_37688/g.82778 Transcript_37688/m.82778 type:complete len:222 (+) Transcript_37688:1043-1708(+)